MNALRGVLAHSFSNYSIMELVHISTQRGQDGLKCGYNVNTAGRVLVDDSQYRRAGDVKYLQLRKFTDRSLFVG